MPSNINKLWAVFYLPKLKANRIFFQNQSQNDVHKSSDWHYYKQKRSELYPILFLTKKMKFMFCRNKSTASYYSFTKGKKYCVFFKFFFIVYSFTMDCLHEPQQRSAFFKWTIFWRKICFCFEEKKVFLFISNKRRCRQ